MPCAQFRTAAVAALVFALMCGAAAHAHERVRLGNLTSVQSGALSYVKEIAARCDIQVEETMFADDAAVMRALAARELDVGASASAISAIAARAGGTPLYIVAAYARGGVRLFARRGQEVRSWQALKGKKVAVTPGSIAELLLMAALDEAALPRGSVQPVFLASSAQGAALLGKQVGALMQSDPQPVDRRQWTEVLRPYETAIGEPVRTVVMTEAFYHRKRALAEKFMACYVLAVKAFADDQALAERYVRDVMFKGRLGSAAYAESLASAPYIVDVSMRQIQITTDAMVRTGLTPMAHPPLAREWVRTDLLEAARKSPGGG
jgi:NitT/TauT family transport system substrate-binding protein